jgi:glutamyl-tRNA synthetase
MKYENEIWAYALKNSIDFGKTDAGRILPKLFNHGLEKKDIGKIMPQIQEIVKKVNSMKKEDIEKEFAKYGKYAIEHDREEKHELPELNNAGKGMVFRLAPFPSGALHLGNAKTYLLNALYAEKYNAKTLLVMDDTIGSEEKQIAPEAYKLLEDAFNLLGINYDKKIVYKSDRLDIYYEYAEKLIEKDKAYVCHCVQDVLRKNRENGKDCECRNLSVKEQLKRWKEMFKAKEGSCVLRIKTSMQDKNPAFRDRVLFKISDRSHPRVGTKYRVWPTLEMSWSIDDHLLGITHIIRGNDLMIETDMEKYIWNIFGWKPAETIHVGLINLEGVGAKISKSKAQKEVKSGKFTGWDDPRTWSIQSLIRRGIKPEAIKQFVKEIGLNKQDITIPIDALYAINRKMIDANADRYYFVADPVKIEIKNMPPTKHIELPVHPDKKENRKIEVGKEIFISKSDFENNKGNEVRLLHLYNISIDKKGKSEFTSLENKNINKIQWVSRGKNSKIIMEDGTWVSGIADEGIENVNENEMIQFERFGFVRLDKKGKENEFWFAHK